MIFALYTLTQLTINSRLIVNCAEPLQYHLHVVFSQYWMYLIWIAGSDFQTATEAASSNQSAAKRKATSGWKTRNDRESTRSGEATETTRTRGAACRAKTWFSVDLPHSESSIDSLLFQTEAEQTETKNPSRPAFRPLTKPVKGRKPKTTVHIMMVPTSGWWCLR